MQQANSEPALTRRPGRDPAVDVFRLLCVLTGTAFGGTMVLRLTLAIALAFVPVLSHAEPPIRLSGDDVSFQFAGLAEDTSHIGSKIAMTKKASSTRMCGFQIQGNHSSHASPHVEWDMNIDQIVTADRSIAGVSAGTFDVTDRKRKARAPITDLSFALESTPELIVAAIQGAPRADNGIVASIEAEPASHLFADFQTMRPIIILMRYADGTSDQLEVRGFRDVSKFSGAKNNYFAQCLRGFRVTAPGEIMRAIRR